MEQAITIRARPSKLDPDSATFSVDREVYAGGPYTFDSKAHAAGAPLPAALFDISGITEVVIHGDTVVVSKQPAASWLDLSVMVGAAIRAQLLTGVPAIVEAASQSDISMRDGLELKREAQRVLDSCINNSIRSHGGKIRCVGVDDGVVHLKMEGGCQGCAAASITLKQGVVVALRKALPQIRGVVDDTDHSSGSAPYYTALHKRLTVR